MSYCKVIMVGRLGADPEIRYTSNGNAVANFRLAVDSGWGDKKRTDWHRCTAWQKTAEQVSQHVRKGSLVLVEGRLENREWQDKDGQKRLTAEVVVDRWNFVGPKQERQEQQPDHGGYSSQGSTYGDDIPF